MFANKLDKPGPLPMRWPLCTIDGPQVPCVAAALAIPASILQVAFT